MLSTFKEEPDKFSSLRDGSLSPVILIHMLLRSTLQTLVASFQTCGDCFSSPSAEPSQNLTG